MKDYVISINGVLNETVYNQVYPKNNEDLPSDVTFYNCTEIFPNQINFNILLPSFDGVNVVPIQSDTIIVEKDQIYTMFDNRAYYYYDDHKGIIQTSNIYGKIILEEKVL